MPASSLDKPGFSTPDITLAAVIMALGFPLLRLDKPNYIFRKIPKWVFEDFDNFQLGAFVTRSAALMRRVLVGRLEMLATLKEAKKNALLRFTDGITDSESGRVAYISEKSSDEQISKTLDILQRP